MTRKFVYDPRTSRVRMVGWTTGSHGALNARRTWPWRWLLAAVALTASAMAFASVPAGATSAAHAAARAGEPAASR